MSNTNTYNQNQIEAFKYRLKLIPVIVALSAVAYGVNEGLWILDAVVILAVIITLIPVKLMLIGFRSLQLARADTKPLEILFFLMVMLTIAFIFDLETVPYLSVYRFGTETNGTVLQFNDTTRADFIIYNFSVEGVVFQNRQNISSTYDEGRKPGQTLTVKYNPNNPKVSYLMDEEYLESQTMLSLFTGLGTILVVFTNAIEEKLKAVIKNGFDVRKPA